MATTFRPSELLSQTSASLSGFFTAQKTARGSDAWPNPELSIGRFISKYGKVFCWETKGPAREAFDDVAPKIKDYLEKSVEPISRWVTWSIYMFGKTPNTASPTIMFCCEVTAHRKEVRNMVRESGLLNGYRGIKTGHMPKAPDFEQLIPLAPEDGQEAAGKMEAFSSREIEGHCNGMKIFVGGSKLPATIGGAIKAGGRFYYTTAAHVFQGYERKAESAAEAEGDEDSGVDIDGFDTDDFDNSDLDNSDSDTDIGLDGVQERAPTFLYEEPPFPAPNTLNRDPGLAYRSLGTSFLTSLDESGSDSGLDYALIEISDSPHKKANIIFHPNFVSGIGPGRGMIATMAVSSSELNKTREVLSVTSREVLTGIISGAPVYTRSPNSTRFTMSLSAVFDSPLQVGDCGAWVVDAQTGNLYGHIVAGSPGTGRAIVVPFHSIFEDIKKRTGERPRLPGEVVDLVDGSWARNLSERFMQLIAEKRTELLLRGEVHHHPENLQSPTARKPPPYTASTAHPTMQSLPILPAPPQQDDVTAQNFRELLLKLSAVPLKYENPGLLDEALGVLPLDRLYLEAEEEAQIMVAEAESLGGDGSRPQWAYRDCVIRALLRWFKREFFTWVNNPPCSVCGTATVATGVVPPTEGESARGATRVEGFRCAAAGCGADERFPRYSDPWKLLETRRGRVGEWANCFAMLCRAVGERVRWVWNAEDHAWVEVYSEHQRRWVHVDPCEEVWDGPLMYTQKWGKKMSYCIAFSHDGAADVRRRYIRKAEHSKNHVRCSEAVLHHIIAEVRNLRRENLSKEERFWLVKEDRREERELSWYIAEEVVNNLSLSALSMTEEGRATKNSKSNKGEGERTTNREWSTWVPSHLYPGSSR